jgi:hypothetical protein
MGYGPSRVTSRPFAVTRLDAALAPDHHVIRSRSGGGRLACEHEWTMVTGWLSRSDWDRQEAAWQAHLDAQIPEIHWRAA